MNIKELTGIIEKFNLAIMYLVGKYMIREVDITSPNVVWNHFADTLEESINLFLLSKAIDHEKNLQKIKDFMIENCQDCKNKKITAVKRTYEYFGRDFATLREYVDIYNSIFNSF